MSVSLSGITGGSGYFNPSSLSPTQRQSGAKALQQLSQDLKAGNLQGAQSDFANFKNSFAAVLGATNGQAGGAGAVSGASAAAVPGASSASGATGASNPLSTDLQSLSQALQSGDVTGAQSAFAKLQSDAQSIQQSQLQGMTPHHHHHHGAFGPAGNSGAQTSADGSAPGTSAAGATGASLGLSVKA